MFKILGSVVVGVFIGAMMLEIVRRERPEMIDSIEKKAKDVTDKLFDNMKEAYDFRELKAENQGQ